MENDFIEIPSMNIKITKKRIYYDKNWFRAHEALAKENSRMLILPEFIEFLNYLKEHPSEENKKIFNEITQKRSPWRGEFIGTYFKEKKDKLYVLTEGKKAEKLEECLMEEKVLISLDEWMENHTSQGLPRLKNSKGELNYQCPKEDCIVRFVTSSNGAILECNANPYEGAPNLGVRAVKQLEN